MAKSKSKNGRAPNLPQQDSVHYASDPKGPSDGPSMRAYFFGRSFSFNRMMRGRCTPAEAEDALSFFTQYGVTRTVTEGCLALSRVLADPNARASVLVALNGAYDLAGQLVEREAAFYGVPVVPFAAMRRATLEAWKNPRRVCEGLVADVADPPGYQDALAELSAKLAAAKTPSQAQTDADKQGRNMTDSPRMLQSTIAELLRRIPDTWQAYPPDDLTETQSQATFLLIGAGLVERRGHGRLWMVNQPVTVEYTYTATGEYGLAEAFEQICAAMWTDWQDAYNKWKQGDTGHVSPFRVEQLEPSEWRRPGGRPAKRCL